MSSIQESSAANLDLSGYKPVDIPSIPSSPTTQLQPTLNPVLRCPIPPIWQTTPDSLRQFYSGGQVPQMRLLTPSPTTNGGGSTGSSTTVIQGGTSSGGGSGTPVIGVPLQATIKTSVLNPNGIFQGVLNISRGFQLLNLAMNDACRVEIYGTQSAQLLDAYRQIDSPPPAGTVQNIICDVVLDTSPYQWAFQSRVGSNGDSPQKGAVYVSITNLSSVSQVLSLTLGYAPIET